ncbi:MAG TPA: succinate dehydrogenase flavoprotein subunit, partial [Betaproteobacteria bacterium]|nr:succinate dehydrogenase flavoprotein subunit [Betaproteobacteria bacterium]
DAIEYMCSVGPEAVFELEHMGLPFSRKENGRIYQRPFGGQSKDFGKGGQAARTCAAADRTGHALLHTLYQGNIAAGSTIFSEWFAVDLVKNAAGAVTGVIAICMETGEVSYIKSKATVLATGGAGRIYASTTNALMNTGDGTGMALRAGFVQQDMEMWQFHPTGIAGAGTLVTEGCRGEGGYLVNKDGERFMERYAPNAKDLAGRDVVARSMMTEILEGRGCGEHKDHVFLKLDHLGKEILHSRLPGITELSKTFAHVDPVEAPIPVVPTCHYMMGGIPTNYRGEVVAPSGENKEAIVPGLFAAGECACASVHGANRLGTNSLTDLLVFGKSAGNSTVEFLKQNPEHKDLPHDAGDLTRERLDRLNNQTNGESVSEVGAALRQTMQRNCGVFRFPDLLANGVAEIKEVEQRVMRTQISDKSKVFNTARIEALELDNLIEVALASLVSADARKESRGAHDRADFAERDDENWLKHTLWFKEGNRLDYKPVHMNPLTAETIEPKVRTY